jgi:hypothetical protein
MNVYLTFLIVFLSLDSFSFALAEDSPPAAQTRPQPRAFSFSKEDIAVSNNHTSNSIQPSNKRQVQHFTFSSDHVVSSVFGTNSNKLGNKSGTKPNQSPERLFQR